VLTTAQNAAHCQWLARFAGQHHHHPTFGWGALSRARSLPDAPPPPPPRAGDSGASRRKAMFRSEETNEERMEGRHSDRLTQSRSPAFI